MILEEIKKRDITWLDMIGGKSISYEKDHERVVRCNRFVAESWSERLIELLCNEPYDPLSECHIIRIPFCDLFQFWWSQCIIQEDMMDEILEDIFVRFKDRLCPIKKEIVTPDYERTMFTYLGACEDYSINDIDFNTLGKAKILHFTGYMWNTENEKKAIKKASQFCRENGIKISFDVLLTISNKLLRPYKLATTSI